MPTAAPLFTGFGLKPQHLAELLAPGRMPAVGAAPFLEVHAENYLGAGGPWLRHLERVRDRWPLSIHGVGLSIGGTSPLDEAHLARLAALLERFEPRWFSEHLAWSSHGGHAFNDLLPLPYDRATLERVCRHVDRAQERLRRRLLLENPSTYVRFASSTYEEGAFLGEVVCRTGCGVLLDVNNAYVSAINHGRDPAAWLDALMAPLPPGTVGEIHLAGHARDHDAAGDPLLIDDHGAPVAAAVWRLYARAIARLGAVPTLIERDNDVPPLAALEAEAAQAAGVQRQVLREAQRSASCEAALA